MTELSPAAESVHNAFWFGHEYPDSLSNEDLAAALRAAAENFLMDWDAIQCCDFLLDMADELEAK